MSRAHKNKTFIICGYFNIYLQKVHKHKTSDFLDKLYSWGLITKTRRITLICATLFDNLFINVMKNIVKSGLLINDICHYLPVSVIFDCQIKRKKEEHCNRYVRVRQETSSRITSNTFWTTEKQNKSVSTGLPSQRINYWVRVSMVFGKINQQF